MNSYAVFLRGINVGGRIVNMADLKECLTKAGLLNVVTFLQSGNVLLDSAETDKDVIRAKIEKSLTETFGYAAIVFVYTKVEIAQIVAAWPFGDTDNDTHAYVIFTDSDEVPAALTSVDSGIEKIALGNECLYWAVPKGQTLDSPLAKASNTSKLKSHTTVRNMNTLNKMLR